VAVDVIVIVDVIDCVIVAALVIGNDTVGVIHAVDRSDRWMGPAGSSSKLCFQKRPRA
jgi:fructose-1,6-bisphosphatase/inositol monophosphatase family enzyme